MADDKVPIDSRLSALLDLDADDLSGDGSGRIAAVSRAFLTVIISFVLLHVLLVGIAGHNAGTSLFAVATAGCAVLLAARWLIGHGSVRWGTWLGAAAISLVGLYAGWFAAFIGVAQAAWVFVAVTYCTLVLGFRAGALAALLLLSLYAVLALAIAAGHVRPQMVAHPFNQWLNLFTPSMILLISTGVLRHSLLAAEKRQRQSNAAAALAREEKLQASREASIELERTVQARTRELEGAVGDLRTLTYLLSHDLAGKLAVIRTFAQVLSGRETSALSPEGQRHLQRIGDNTRELQQMVDGLLAYARTSTLTPNISRVDLDSIVQSIVVDLRHAHPGLEVEGALGEVDTDPVMLRHVIQNLLANACKYGAIEGRARVTLSREAAGVEDVFCVADAGAGFVPADADRLFELFERGEQAARHDGAGVGLAVVKHLVAKLGGRAWAESTGGGARFCFSLPRTGPGAIPKLARTAG